MRDGAEVIYQATFSRDGWRGRADFLVRVDEPSDLGAWSYEPYDTKLARTREAGGRAPARLVRGRDRARSRDGCRSGCTSCSGRARSSRTGLPTSTPICASRSGGCVRTSRNGRRRTRGRASTARAATSSRSADERWKSDDHLTRVASIRRDQIGKLATVDVTTLTGLAEAPPGLSVRRLAPAMVETLRDQAALQLHRYRSGEIRYRLLEPEERRGLGLLPAPSPGDVFFDMEGDPFFDPACGLEFLFGVLWREPDGSVAYRPFWAYDREGERRAFEEFVDFVSRAQASVPGHARLPLRRLRAVDARAADGHARDTRGGDRRVPARRGACRPAPGRAAGDARRRRVVLAEGRREAVLHAAGRGRARATRR